MVKALTKRLITTTLTLLCLLTAVGSQLYTLPSITAITNRDGLPSDYIVDIDIDAKGFLWIATKETLSRYDGYNVRVYSDKHSNDSLILGKMISAIEYIDNSNTLLIGTNKGLYQINSNNEEVSQVEYSQKLTSQVINNILYDKGRIWISTTYGFNIYDTKSGEFKAIPILNNQNKALGIKRIVCDAKGDGWLAHGSNGFSRYDIDKEEIIRYPNIMKNLFITGFIFDKERVYATTWEQGIHRLITDQEGNTTYKKCNIRGLEKGIISSYARDNNMGYHWIGTPKGIFVVDDLCNPKFLKNIRSGFNEDQLSNEEVWSILPSKNENLMWIGTRGGGVNKIDSNLDFITKNNLNNIKEQFNSNTVTAIYDHGDDIWLGIKSVGLVVVNKKSRKSRHFSTLIELGNISDEANGINVITEIKSRNEVWLGSRYDGVWVVKLSKDKREIVKTTHLKDLIQQNEWQAPANDISCIFEDNIGQVWITGSEGIFVIGDYKGKYKARKLTNWNRNDLIPKTQFTGIAQTDDGKMWFSTITAGVYTTTYNPSDNKYPKYKRIKIIDGSSKRSLTTTMFHTSSDEIMVAVPNIGIFKYNPQLEHFEIDDNLPNHELGIVTNILEPSPSELWIGTNRGVFNYTTPKNGISSILRYTYKDGLCDNIVIENSGCLGKDGQIYFGSYNGYSRLQIDQRVVNKYMPYVAATDITIGEKTILTKANGRGSCVIRNKQGEIESISLRNGDQSLAIEFTSLSMHNPTKNNYLYMLEGYDKSWQRIEASHRTAAFSNIRAGSYTLKVMATNDSEVWSDRVLTIPIKVIPRWYNSRLAWVIYTLMVMSLVVFVSRLFLIRIKLRNQLRIAQIKQNTDKELNSAKLQFFTNVSHELLTPLSIISYGIDELQRDNNIKTPTHKILKDNISRLLRLVQQILEFRKADTGNLKLKVSRGEVVGFVKRLAYEDFRPMTQRKHLTIRVKSNCEVINGWFDTDKIDKIVYNLLSNAVKYNIENGSIDVNIIGEGYDSQTDTHSGVTIQVRNTGDVIPSERITELFTRFYDGAYRKFEAKGCGIGLSLSKDLVELHRGTIGVESTVELGTRFTVYFPIAHDAFDLNQIDNQNSTSTNGASEPIGHASIEEKPTSNEPSDSDNTNIEKIEAQQEEELLDQELVLIVEDDPDLMVMVSSIISNKYNIACATNGEQGIEMARRFNPAVIVSDVVMPIKDGYEMSRTLKSSIETSHIPIILLSARIATEDKVQGLDIGVDAYLTKPIEGDLLLAQITSLVSNRRKIASRFSSTPSVEQATEQAHMISTIDDKFIQRAIAVVEENIDNSEFEVKDFVEGMNVTNSTLYRKLKSLTDLSPNEFIRNIRLKKAYQIIEEKGDRISISEVAYMVGFNSPKYFSTCFKRMYSEIPSDTIERVSSEQK